ncbi:hypothetical protein J6590_020255 [Homalodisca vitripennis]|nr:hypothetical protein J6590_020255 [Homalodisca vitripennis]
MDIESQKVLAPPGLEPGCLTCRSFMRSTYTEVIQKAELRAPKKEAKATARRVLKMSEVCLVLLHSNVPRLFTPSPSVPPSYFKLVFTNGNIKLGTTRGSERGTGED